VPKTIWSEKSPVLNNFKRIKTIRGSNLANIVQMGKRKDVGISL